MTPPASLSPFSPKVAQPTLGNTQVNNKIIDDLAVKVHKLTQDTATIISKIETKRLEVELLNTEVKTAYTTIESLQQRISVLERQNTFNSEQQLCVADPPPPVKYLLLGDTNLRRVHLALIVQNSVK